MIHLVTGKGGVGKSTFAGALALALAQKGERTLLVEFGERSYQRHLFQTSVSYQPTAVQSHLSLALWDGELCLREYLLYLLKVEGLVNLFFDNKIMKALVQAAPALKELALLGKVTSRERRMGPPMPFDHLVVDAYSTGHFRALWRAPRGMAQAIPFGPMGEQSRGMEKVLGDAQLCRLHVVTTPEELPVTEALELAQDIHQELKQTPQIVLNRFLDVDLRIEQLRELQGNEFAEYVAQLLERQNGALARIQKAGWECLKMPWLFVDSPVDRIRTLSQKVTGHD